MNFLFSEIKNLCSHFFKWMILLICLLGSTQFLNAQFYKIEKYTELDGLISSAINTIYQDNRGYLWIGTENGLSQFNGYEFKNYTNRNGLNNNFIKSIYQDSKNNIWIGTNEGLNKINPAAIDKDQIESVFQGVIVTSIIEFENEIYFGSNVGLHKIVNKDSFQLIDLPRIRSLVISDNKLFAGASGGLFECQLDMGLVKNVWSDEDPGFSFVRTVLEESDSTFLIGTMKGLIEWNRSKSADAILMNVDRISHLIRDSNNRIWVASENGLARIDHRDILTSFKESEFNKSCSYILEDQEKNIWVAGIDGLMKYSEYPFQRLDFSENLESNGISTILYTNKNEIWYGGSEGDIWIEHENGSLENFDKIKSYSDNKPINELFEDSKGNIWISTLLKGVFIWDGQKLESFNDPKGLLRFFTFDIEEASDETFWFGGARGLVNYKNDKFRYYTFKNADQTPFVTDIHIDSRDRVWLALNSGIGIIKGDNIYRISAFEGKSCSQISSDSQGNLYAATTDFGLIKFAYENDSVMHKNGYNLESGLSNNRISSVHIDQNDIIWLGTDFGINKINNKDEIEIFKVKENLLRSKCYLNSIAETENNMIFGTYDGTISIPKVLKKTEAKSPNTFITAVSILNDDYDTSLVKSDSSYFNLPVNLELPYNANFISFSFEGLSFNSSEDLEYQYRLEGLENDFSEASKERNFTYANLDKGKYTFQVRSRRPNDKWSENLATFTFKIRPPFWEKWWFRILMISLFFGLLFMIVNNRIQNVRKEEKEKSDLNRKMAEFRLTALRAQMNPHFIFNALYSIQHFITINEKEAAINYLAKFASLIRLILENSGKNEILVSEEVKMLDLYLDLEKLRFDNKFQYKIEVDQAIHEEDTAIPYLLIQPFVENAVIHGVGYKKDNGLISIKFLPTEDEDLLLCVVEDNGVGREEAEKLKKPSPIKSQSLGLKVNKERLEILNPNKIKDTSVKIVDLKNDNSEPCGTRVEITIPIS